MTDLAAGALPAGTTALGRARLELQPVPERQAQAAEESNIEGSRVASGSGHGRPRHKTIYPVVVRIIVFSNAVGRPGGRWPFPINVRLEHNTPQRSYQREILGDWYAGSTPPSGRKN